MRANCWMGKRDLRVETVPDPKILNQHDAIVKITSTAICGSDLHLYNGFVPTMESGDILGHEFMGEVVEVGREVKNLKKGDRVVVPFPIACGKCFSCQQGLFSVCENTNPNAWMAEKMWGHSPCGIFGYSHLLGGYAGGQAEYARVPFADVGPIKVPEGMADEQVLFLSDIFPTGYMGADMCNIQAGRHHSRLGLRSGRPVRHEERVSARGGTCHRDRPHPGAACAWRRKRQALRPSTTSRCDIYEALREMTGGRGPDSCIDAVGMESHAPGLTYAYDRAKQAMMLESDRPIALRQAIMACRNGGTVSVIGVYGGFIDKFPWAP